MIAPVARSPHAHDQAEPAANPLRRGDLVICPACERHFIGWRRTLVRPERYQEHTACVYKCPNQACRFVFALAE